jgi:hypothetical protein
LNPREQPVANRPSRWTLDGHVLAAFQGSNAYLTAVAFGAVAGDWDLLNRHQVKTFWLPPQLPR